METATRDTPKSQRPRFATLIRVETSSSGDAFNRAIVDQLRAAAADSGKSYWEIADAADISRTTLTRLFSVATAARSSDLKMQYLYAICQVLGLDIVGVISRAEQHVRDQARDRTPRRSRKPQ